MDITVEEFLQRKGAIGLLSLLHERPMTYSEIEPEIEVTSSTIVERRDDAAELGLIKLSLGQGEVGTKRVYNLTDMGEFLTDKMAREGIISNYRKMRALQQLVDEQTDGLVTWVQENPSQLLQFDAAMGGTILKGDEMTGDSRSESTSETGSSTSPRDREEPPAADKYPSSMDGEDIDPPEQPSDRDDSQDEGRSVPNADSTDESRLETSDDDTESSDTNEAPSNQTPALDETPDPEDLKQGTFEDMSRDENPTKEGDDTGS